MILPDKEQIQMQKLRELLIYASSDFEECVCWLTNPQGTSINTIFPYRTESQKKRAREFLRLLHEIQIDALKILGFPDLSEEEEECSDVPEESEKDVLARHEEFIRKLDAYIAETEAKAEETENENNDR